MFKYEIYYKYFFILDSLILFMSYHHNERYFLIYYKFQSNIFFIVSHSIFFIKEIVYNKKIYLIIFVNDNNLNDYE